MSGTRVGGWVVFVLCRCVVLGPCTSVHWDPARVLRARSRCSRRRCRRRRRVTMAGQVGDGRSQIIAFEKRVRVFHW